MRYRVKIGNERLQYRRVVIDDPVTTARQTLELAGLSSPKRDDSRHRRRRELAVAEQAQTLLMPAAARRQLSQLNDLRDKLWTRINVEFYKDDSDAVFKALVE